MDWKFITLVGLGLFALPKSSSNPSASVNDSAPNASKPSNPAVNGFIAQPRSSSISALYPSGASSANVIGAYSGWYDEYNGYLKALSNFDAAEKEHASSDFLTVRYNAVNKTLAWVQEKASAFKGLTGQAPTLKMKQIFLGN